MPAVTLRVQPGAYAVSRLAPDASVPAWAVAPGFSSVTRTPDELSIVCAESVVPSGFRAERDWALLQFAGPFDLSAVGILASVAQPLAAAGISLLALGTFDTDYILIKREHLQKARLMLTAAGHTLREA
jgi:hypothetical protein